MSSGRRARCLRQRSDCLHAAERYLRLRQLVPRHRATYPDHPTACPAPRDPRFRRSALLKPSIHKMERIRLHNALHRMRIANHPYDFMLPDHISYFSPKTLAGRGFVGPVLTSSICVRCLYRFCIIAARAENGTELRARYRQIVEAVW